MIELLDEEVPPVNPLSITAIEELGRCFLAQLAPEMLAQPCPLNVMNLIEVRLPEFGIHVSPATREEIGDRDGATDPQGDADVNILVSENVWEALEFPAPTSHYARATVCHEIGHALLHVPVIRRRLLLDNVLARVPRRQLKAYEDPEWQAWTFAGAILMPSETLRQISGTAPGTDITRVSRIYEVSEAMAKSHLRKLKWLSAQ